MVTHSSILAWRIPRTEEPSGLPSMGSHRVGHDCSDLLTGLDAPVLDISPGFQDTLVAQTVKNLPAMQETSV